VEPAILPVAQGLSTPVDAPPDACSRRDGHAARRYS